MLREQDFLGPHFGFADRQAPMVSVDVIPVGKYSRDARRVDVQNLVGVSNSIMARDGWLFGASDSRRPGGWVAGY